MILAVLILAALTALAVVMAACAMRDVAEMEQRLRHVEHDEALASLVDFHTGGAA